MWLVDGEVASTPQVLLPAAEHPSRKTDPANRADLTRFGVPIHIMGGTAPVSRLAGWNPMGLGHRLLANVLALLMEMAEE